MINDFFPRGILEKNVKSYSPQSLLFGHRMKPAETPYEYLIEFLCVANAHKKITDGSHTYILTDMFPVNEMIYDHVISYMPVSNMGLKRFIFFANSRMDTKAACDKDAYNSCIEMLKKHIDNEGSNIDKDKCLSVVQNILYGFSVENAGRSWFTKNLLANYIPKDRTDPAIKHHRIYASSQIPFPAMLHIDPNQGSLP